MTANNERFVNKLLESAIRSGDTSSALNDEVVDRVLAQPASISDVSRKRVKSALKRRIQDQAIAAASKAVRTSTALPFGRYVETIREQAQLERPAIGARLKKSTDFVERFERGHIDPRQLSPSEFADIAELFQIKFAAFPAMLAASTAAAGAKHGYSAIARSHGGMKHERRGEDVERALEAFARAVPPKRNPASELAEEIQIYLNKVETELRRRGRDDLLT